MAKLPNVYQHTLHVFDMIRRVWYSAGQHDVLVHHSVGCDDEESDAASRDGQFLSMRFCGHVCDHTRSVYIGGWERTFWHLMYRMGEQKACRDSVCFQAVLRELFLTMSIPSMYIAESCCSGGATLAFTSFREIIAHAHAHYGTRVEPNNQCARRAQLAEQPPSMSS